MESKKTAIDWLVQELRNGKELNANLIEQAKQMEKQQMIKIADHCLSTVKIIDKKSGFVAMAAEQYYWENFNN